jgi:hypothetical protein
MEETGKSHAVNKVYTMPILPSYDVEYSHQFIVNFSLQLQKNSYKCIHYNVNWTRSDQNTTEYSVLTAY